MKVAVLKGGGGLERQVSLRSGARVEDALASLGHEVLAIDVGADLVATLKAERPEVAFVALHGRGGEDGTVQELLEILRIPYTGPGRPRLRALDRQGRRQARAARRRRPDPRLGRLQLGRLPRARRRRRARGDRGEPRLPAGDQAGRRRLRARGPLRRASPRRSPRRWSPPSPTTTASCSSATSRGASWRSR